jgi:hypothetical protein
MIDRIRAHLTAPPITRSVVSPSSSILIPLDGS